MGRFDFCDGRFDNAKRHLRLLRIFETAGKVLVNATDANTPVFGNCYSSGCGKLVQHAAMRSPRKLIEVRRAAGGFASGFRRCVATQRRVHAMRNVILTKSPRFSGQIIGLPGQQVELCYI